MRAIFNYFRTQRRQQQGFMYSILNACSCLEVKIPVNTDGVISYNYGTSIYVVRSSISFTRDILIGQNEKKK